MKRSLFTLIIACLLVFSCLFSVFAFADAADADDYGDPEAAANFAARCEAAGYHTVSMRDDFLTIYGEQVQKSDHPALDFSDGEAAAAA